MKKNTGTTNWIIAGQGDEASEIEKRIPSEVDTIVVGDGAAALACVGFLGQSGSRVLWVVGTGSSLKPVLPILEEGRGAQAWAVLASRLGMDSGEPVVGSFLREFKNKSFRKPAWCKNTAAAMHAQEVREEWLWAPEARVAPLVETRMSLMGLDAVDACARERVMTFTSVTRLEGVQVTAISLEEGRLAGVVLGTGKRVVCSRMIYADRWSKLTEIEGVPKPLPFVRHRDPVGVLQATFTHPLAIRPEAQEVFFTTLHREQGDECDRHLFGYFSADGLQSTWSLFLTPSEAEDNHEISKKLRRMKQALDKMFVGPEWLGEGVPDFLSTIVSEQVRFEESLIFTKGHAPEKVLHLPSISGVSIVTDGYGPGSALEQVVQLLGEELAIDLTVVSAEAIAEAAVSVDPAG